jgi:hypothetical protein
VFSDVYGSRKENFLQGKKNRFFRIEEKTLLLFSFLMRKAEKLNFLNRIFSTSLPFGMNITFSVEKEKLPEI